MVQVWRCRRCRRVAARDGWTTYRGSLECGTCLYRHWIVGQLDDPRAALRGAWLAWQASGCDISTAEDALDGVHDGIAEMKRVRTWGFSGEADAALLAAWERWQADPGDEAAPDYLRQAFAAWCDMVASLE